MISHKKDILIIGAGPTGLTLACALANYGISSRIIDKRGSSSLIPRAININHSTLAIFKKIGIPNRFWSDALILDELTIYWKKKRLLNINDPYNKLYPNFFHLEQSRVETYLTELLESLNSKVDRGSTLERVEEDTDGVKVTIKHLNSEIEYNKYLYIIGCDGGNSVVKDLLKISCERQDYHSYFVLADVEIEHNYPIKKLHYYVSDVGYLIIVPLPRDKYRIIASFKGVYSGKDADVLRALNLQKIIDERGPGHIVIKKVIWSTSSGFYHKLATTAKKGRVFLAGDALHQFSPVGGTNMNVGIQDAYVLANKFHQVINNISKPSYLDTYAIERMSVAEQYIEATKKATWLLTRCDKPYCEEKNVVPEMENKLFIQSYLPKLFSGMEFLPSY